MNNKNTIVLTGATGHLGSNLLHYLLDEGHQIKALYRNKVVPYHHKNLTWVKGDVNNVDAISELIKNASVIVHCASVISLGDVNKETVFNVNVKGTETLLQVCKNANIRFIYISSSTVAEDPVDGEVFDENRPYKRSNDFYYAWTKAMSEKMVLKAVMDQGLDAFIIRPTAIVGPADHKPSHFGQTIFDIYHHKLPFITNGGYNLIDVRDLSRTISNSILKGKKGEIYLVGGHYLSFKNLITLINPTKKPRVLSVDFIKFLLPLIRVYDTFFKLKWPVTTESLDTLKFAPKKVLSYKAITELDHQIRPTKKSIEDLLTWYNKNKTNES